ncbi:hypothetical protein D3C81_953380 [compost metagenome]
MLGPADIQVNRKPFLLLLFRAQLVVIMRIDIAQVIPAAAGPLRHRVGLTASRFTGFRINRVNPVGDVRERRLSSTRRFDGVDIRQDKRELILRYRLHRAVLQMQDRDRLAPIPLAAEQPVAQAVSHFAAAFAVLFQPGDHFLDPFLFPQPVQEAGVHMFSFSRISFLRQIAACDHLNDRQIKLLGEFVIALVMPRYCHDGTRTVTCEHVVGNPDRQLRAVHRIDRIGAGEYPSFLLRQIGALQVALARCLVLVSLHRFALGIRRDGLDQFMLRR